jgi:hypothetical protein
MMLRPMPPVAASNPKDSATDMIHDRHPTEDGNKAVTEKAGRGSRPLGFLGSRKPFWLLPFLLVTALLFAAVLLAKGPAIVPFIYRSF